jgi:hypothetical protein
MHAPAKWGLPEQHGRPVEGLPGGRPLARRSPPRSSSLLSAWLFQAAWRQGCDVRRRKKGQAAQQTGVGGDRGSGRRSVHFLYWLPIHHQVISKAAPCQNTSGLDPSIPGCRLPHPPSGLPHHSPVRTALPCPALPPRLLLRTLAHRSQTHRSQTHRTPRVTHHTSGTQIVGQASSSTRHGRRPASAPEPLEPRPAPP